MLALSQKPISRNLTIRRALLLFAMPGIYIAIKRSTNKPALRKHEQRLPLEFDAAFAHERGEVLG